MNRSIGLTLAFIVDKLKEKPELSFRKQLCLQYLRWGVTKKEKDLRQFVEMTKQWRKEERGLGTTRTLLERRARKLYPLERRLKIRDKNREIGSLGGSKVRDSNIGGMRQEVRERALETLRTKRPPRNQGQWWRLFPPDGEPFVIRNLRAFCRENGLLQNMMVATALHPEQRRHHKGWRAEKYDPTWEKINGDG